MNHAGSAVPGIVIALVVLVLVLWRQLSTRPLRERPLVAVILVLLGVAETVPVASRSTLSPRDAGLLLLSLAIGIALAALRALTVRIWADGDRVLRRGTILTALLWLASLAQHVTVTASVSDTPGLNLSNRGRSGLAVVTLRPGTLTPPPRGCGKACRGSRGKLPGAYAAFGTSAR